MLITGSAGGAKRDNQSFGSAATTAWKCYNGPDDSLGLVEIVLELEEDLGGGMGGRA
jgi:hypothetical protein